MIPWTEFGSEAFELARARRKPILLFVAPRWSHQARHFLKEFKAPKVDSLVNGGYVPVLVDSERRPDIAARYPGLSILTPRGDIIGEGAHILPASELAVFLSKAAAEFNSDPEGATARLLRDRRAFEEQEALFELQEKLDETFPRRVFEALKADFDAEHGGFGKEDKRPQLDSLELLLYAAVEWKDASAADMLRKTLAAIAEGGIRDREEGGFFAHAERDWSNPWFEKPLAYNARLARIFMDAAAALNEPAWREVAGETIGWMKLSLHDQESGLFFASQFADPEAVAKPKGARLRSTPYELDRTLFADANAAAVPLLLKAACAWPDRRDEFEDLAARVLNALESRFFDHHDGMLHYADGPGPAKERGFLGDQAWAMLAFTEAFQHFMDREYRDFADELLRLTLRIEWYREKAGFLDRESGSDLPGLLASPRLPLELNAVALEALWRLSEMKGIPNYARWLKMAFMNLLPRVEGHPHEAAGYARLFDMFLKGRLELDLIGRTEDPETKDLLTEVKKLYLPRALVSFIDPNDMDFILAHRLTAPKYPRLFLISNGRPANSSDKPQEIPTLFRSMLPSSLSEGKQSGS